MYEQSFGETEADPVPSLTVTSPQPHSDAVPKCVSYEGAKPGDPLAQVITLGSSRRLGVLSPPVPVCHEGAKLGDSMSPSSDRLGVLSPRVLMWQAIPHEGAKLGDLMPSSSGRLGVLSPSISDGELELGDPVLPSPPLSVTVSPLEPSQGSQLRRSTSPSSSCLPEVPQLNLSSPPVPSVASDALLKDRSQDSRAHRYAHLSAGDTCIATPHDHLVRPVCSAELTPSLVETHVAELALHCKEAFVQEISESEEEVLEFDLHEDEVLECDFPPRMLDDTDEVLESDLSPHVTHDFDKSRNEDDFQYVDAVVDAQYAVPMAGSKLPILSSHVSPHAGSSKACAEPEKPGPAPVNKVSAVGAGPVGRPLMTPPGLFSSSPAVPHSLRSESCRQNERRSASAKAIAHSRASSQERGRSKSVDARTPPRRVSFQAGGEGDILSEGLPMVRQRPVSSLSSDQCNLSSPPSAPSSLGNVRLGATHHSPAPPSIASSGSGYVRSIPVQQTGRSHADLLGSMPTPSGFTVEVGARVPFYAPAPTIGAAGPARLYSQPAAGPEVPLPPAPPVGANAHRASSASSAAADPFKICYGYPPRFSSRLVREDEDAFPFNDDDGVFCCNCHAVVPSDPDRWPFICRGFCASGEDRCLHALCSECASLPTAASDLCGCFHAETPEGRAAFVEPWPAEQSFVAPPVIDPTLKVLEVMAEKLTALCTQPAAPTQRRGQSQMKTTTVVEFTKGSPEALCDLDAWLLEFDRVVLHISGGEGLIAQDRITHLLSCWSGDTDIGENMRLDQREDAYRTLEKAGKYQECLDILLNTLDGYRVAPVEARRHAEALWNGLAWPDNIESFHTLLRRARTALRKVHQAPPDDMVVMKYLELMPPEKAVALEDPIRRPAVGWTPDTIMAAARGLFKVDDAYSLNAASGQLAIGLPPRGGVWPAAQVVHLRPG